MTVEVGDKVQYFPADGRVSVEAEVTAVNDDGSVHVLYPHPLNELIQATADGVQHGGGSYQYLDASEAVVGTALPADRDALNELASQKGVLEARIEVLEDLLAAAEAERDTAQGELKSLLADRDAIATAAAAAATTVISAVTPAARGRPRKR